MNEKMPISISVLAFEEVSQDDVFLLISKIPDIRSNFLWTRSAAKGFHRHFAKIVFQVNGETIIDPQMFTKELRDKIFATGEIGGQYFHESEFVAVVGTFPPNKEEKTTRKAKVYFFEKRKPS